MTEGPNRWELNGLDLVAGTGIGWSLSTLADGWSLGSPEAAVFVRSTLAADGDDERVDRYGNRTVEFRVHVTADDSGAAQDAERTLALALRAGELVWQSPDARGAATVFDVAYATMQYVADDFDLIGGNTKVRATYALSVRCAPWVRPVDPVVKTLTFSETVSLTTIRDGTSLSNVSATSFTTTPGQGIQPATLSLVTYSGDTAIKATPPATRPYGLLEDVYTFTNLALTASRAYLVIDVATDANNPNVSANLSLNNGGTAFGTQVAIETLPNGYRRHYIAHGLAGTTVTLRVSVTNTSYTQSGASPATYIGGIYASNTAPKTGLMLFEVEGSQRAPFSLRLNRADTGSLGYVTIFSDPMMAEYGYTPGIQSTWPNAPAGSYILNLNVTGVVGQVYTATLDGKTATSAVTQAGVPVLFTFQFGARRDGRLGSGVTGGTYTVNGGTATAIPATSTLLRDAPGETSLTYIQSAPGKYLFLESPTLASPRIGLWAGSLEDGSDAVAVTTALAADPMTIAPPLAAIYVRSPAVTADIASQVTYYPRSHTFVPSAVVA